MRTWDAKEFAKKLNAGELNGQLAEELEKLSEVQLREVLQLLAEKPSPAQPD